ncbi:MAG: hypothetical protein IPF69_07960 [Chitinophagaceae bacterium]|nr:hypothetical protein [Chitinophagaceae bacterium]
MIIVSGHIVTLNTNTNTLLSLSVNGTLSFSGNNNCNEHLQFWFNNVVCAL